MRKIAVVTTSRADYGHLFSLIDLVHRDPDVELQLVVTGMHLVSAFGMTVDQIAKDFPIAARIAMMMADDSGVAIGKSMAVGLMSMVETFDRLDPDIIVVLGDRFEILPVAQAALALRRPLAHLHGGEATEGLMDEAIRHAVTKMAHLHFVAAAPYARRVIQMGEDPMRVFTVGAPGLDQVSRLTLLSRAELLRSLDLTDEGPLFAVTYHPLTLDAQASVQGIEALLGALETFPKARVVVTGSNADPENGVIGLALAQFSARHGERVRVVQSLGQTRYLSLVAAADAVVGNSSSGLIEAPALRTPTVNIGDRQRGRLKAASVIDVTENCELIRQAIATALDPAFRDAWPDALSLYGQGDAGERIVAILKTYPLEGILMKSFRDQDTTP